MQYLEYDVENINEMRAKLQENYKLSVEEYFRLRRLGEYEKAKRARSKMIKYYRSLANFEERMKAKSDNFKKNSYKGKER